MELDFTGLIPPEHTEPEEKRPHRMDAEPPLESEARKAPPESQSQPEATTGATEANPKLQRKADARKQEKEQARKIFETYQKNIKATSQLQTEILKGVKSGEDIYSLFLKATEALSLATENRGFKDQIEKDLKTIYGLGLGEESPLEMELENTRNRLQKLRTAEEKVTDRAEKETLQKAIRSHQKREQELTDRIRKEGEWKEA